MQLQIVLFNLRYVNKKGNKDHKIIKSKQPGYYVTDR